MSLDDNDKIDADSEAESFVEEDWNDPEQGEVPKWTEPDLSIPAGTRSGNRKHRHEVQQVRGRFPDRQDTAR